MCKKEILHYFVKDGIIHRPRKSIEKTDFVPKKCLSETVEASFACTISPAAEAATIYL
jgi:hypothetical protein